MVSGVDVFATLADALEFHVDEMEIDGISLLDPVPAGRGVYFESLYANVEFGWSPLRAWTTPDLRYIDAPSPELYDLSADPGELRDLLVAIEDPRAEELSAELAAFLLKRGADKAALDSRGAQPADLARMRGHPKVKL